MPTYDYRCDANGRVVEARHRISEDVRTWGELCGVAGIEPGDTPPESPVTRLATGGNLVNSGSLANADAPACTTGGCAGGFCGL